MSQSGTPAHGTVLTLDTLDEATAGLLALAAAVAAGDEGRIAERARQAVAAGVPAAWADELLLQSVLMVGYPRALVGAAAWRAATGVPAPADDPSRAETAAEWLARGEATCRLIYGGNYERLRENVRRLHPALDSWMVTEGYGRVLSRPGLDPGRRELCAIAQIAVLGAERQLHSHLRGALHCGVAVTAVDEALRLLGPDLDPPAAAAAARTWALVRDRREPS